MKPLLLDLFCGAGGCSKGYADAGFEVVGVDLHLQPRYPFDFIQADALEYLDTANLSRFAAIHASPVCKSFSFASQFHGQQANHQNLIPPVRERLQALGIPYVIENVAGAPLIKAIMLCGTMFGLNVVRHRYFESNMLLFQPTHTKHTKKAGNPGSIPAENEYWCVVGHFGHKDEAQAAMGIHWMENQAEIAQAIPPAYTQYIGNQLILMLENAA